MNSRTSIFPDVGDLPHGTVSQAHNIVELTFSVRDSNFSLLGSASDDMVDYLRALAVEASALADATQVVLTAQVVG